MVSICSTIWLRNARRVFFRCIWVSAGIRAIEKSGDFLGWLRNRADLDGTVDFVFTLTHRLGYNVANLADLNFLTKFAVPSLNMTHMKEGETTMRRPLVLGLLAYFIVMAILAFFPLDADAKRVKVRSYTRKDGTFVKSHYRTRPDSNPYNNYSFPGNFNPNTGRYSTGNPSTYLENYNSSRINSSFSTSVAPRERIHIEADITHKPSIGEWADSRRLLKSTLELQDAQKSYYNRLEGYYDKRTQAEQELLILELALLIRTDQQQRVTRKAKNKLDALVATAIDRNKMDLAVALYRLYSEQTPADFLEIITIAERETAKAAKSKPSNQSVKQREINYDWRNIQPELRYWKLIRSQQLAQPLKEVRYGETQKYLESMKLKESLRRVFNWKPQYVQNAVDIIVEYQNYYDMSNEEAIRMFLKRDRGITSHTRLRSLTERISY